jgi:hypothetical protein
MDVRMRDMFSNTCRLCKYIAYTYPSGLNIIREFS